MLSCPEQATANSGRHGSIMSSELWLLAATIAIACSRDIAFGIRNRGLHTNNRGFDENLITSEIYYVSAQAVVCECAHMRQMTEPTRTQATA